MCCAQLLGCAQQTSLLSIVGFRTAPILIGILTWGPLVVKLLRYFRWRARPALRTAAAAGFTRRRLCGAVRSLNFLRREALPLPSFCLTRRYCIRRCFSFLAAGAARALAFCGVEHCPRRLLYIAGVSSFLSWGTLLLLLCVVLTTFRR